MKREKRRSDSMRFGRRFGRFVWLCSLFAGFSPFSGFSEVLTVESRTTETKKISRKIAQTKKKVASARAQAKPTKSRGPKKKVVQVRRRVVPKVYSRKAPARVTVPIHVARPRTAVAPLYAGSPQSDAKSPPSVNRMTDLKPLAPKAEKSETVHLDLVPKPIED